jgi:hypothetical protein
MRAMLDSYKSSLKELYSFSAVWLAFASFAKLSLGMRGMILLSPKDL